VGGFSADWLALREDADRRARSATLIAAAGALLAGTRAPVVCDMGAGTGAALRAFRGHFPADTRWCLVDDDADALAWVEAPDVTAHVVDLAAEPAVWEDDCALVTATALFDLAAPVWIDRLATALARDRLPLLACLTFDGRLELDPVHALDGPMIAAFHAHQHGDKGLGGAAAGPDAPQVLAAALRERGFDVRVEDTPWRLTRERDGALIDAVLGGWADAARQLGDPDAGDIAHWLDARLDATVALTVGHRDILAMPQAERSG